MTTLHFPGEHFPRYLSLSISAPDGWQPLPAVGLPLAVVKAVPEGQFRANVIAVLSRFGPQYTLAEAAGDVVDKLAPLPEYAEVSREETEVQGYPAFRIEAAYLDARAGTLVQAVRLVLVDRGSVRDLVQLTGTCEGSQVEETLAEIRQIQDSLTVR